MNKIRQNQASSNGTCSFSIYSLIPQLGPLSGRQALSNGEQIHEGFLFSDSFVGYKSPFAGCDVDPKGLAAGYDLSNCSVSVARKKTGVRAFCTDQTGELRYGANDSAESCRLLQAEMADFSAY
jgi:hypothetical protein